MSKLTENELFERSWARACTDAAADTRFDKSASGLYVDPITRAAFVMWRAANKEASGIPDAYCVTAPNGDCVSTDPRCMHQPRLQQSTFASIFATWRFKAKDRLIPKDKTRRAHGKLMRVVGVQYDMTNASRQYLVADSMTMRVTVLVDAEEVEAQFLRLPRYVDLDEIDDAAPCSSE